MKLKPCPTVPHLKAHGGQLRNLTPERCAVDEDQTTKPATADFVAARRTRIVPNPPNVVVALSVEVSQERLPNSAARDLQSTLDRGI